MEEKEAEKLLHMEEELKSKVIGQDIACSAISRALRRSRADIKDPRRPIGSFLFMGPTGVGKTYLARNLAEIMFGTAEALIQVDMSEYMEKFSTSRLIGAPPGYVGHDDGGQLTEQVRRRPYAVILFDEVEKAHPDVFNVLLQVLDDGRITDSHGRTVDFKNTILILTSNLGSDLILEGIDGRGEITEEAREGVSGLLRRAFRPEFLNRLDEIIFYKPLTRENIDSIVTLQLADLQRRLAQKQVRITMTDAARDHIVAAAYDPLFGARPLKRYLQSKVETLVARKMIREDIEPGTVLQVDVADGGLVIL